MLLAPAAQLAIQQFGWQQAYGLASLGFVMVFILMVLLPWRRIAAGMIAPENPADDTVLPTKTLRGPSLAEALRCPNFGVFCYFWCVSYFGICRFIADRCLSH